MSKKTLLLSVMVIVIALVSCTNRNKKKDQTNDAASDEAFLEDTHNASNSLSYGGTYEGMLPYADCLAADVVITLDYDSNYTKKITCQESISTSVGKFIWDEKGTVITLTGEGGSEKFKVIENAIVMLDTDGNAKTGDSSEMYTLKQTLVLD